MAGRKRGEIQQINGQVAYQLSGGKLEQEAAFVGRGGVAGTEPGATIAATLLAVPLAFEDDAERYAEGLHRAGLPQE